MDPSTSCRSVSMSGVSGEWRACTWCPEGHSILRIGGDEMKIVRIMTVLGLTMVLLALPNTLVPAGSGNVKTVEAELGGFRESPPISTPAQGHFRAEVHENFITYTLTYSGLRANGTASHIHFGQRNVNGDVVAFLCGGGGKHALSRPRGHCRGNDCAWGHCRVDAPGDWCGRFRGGAARDTQ